MKSEAVIRRAKKLWQVGQPKQAFAILTEFLVKSPKNAAVRTVLVDRLLAESITGHALQVLADGVMHNPSNADFQKRFVSVVRSVKLRAPEGISSERRRLAMSSLEGALIRALREGWGPVNGLSKPACDLVVEGFDGCLPPSLPAYDALTTECAVEFLSSPIVRTCIESNLLNTIMQHALVVRPDLEVLITAIRRAALYVLSKDRLEPLAGDIWPRFLCGLALNMFQSEYASYQFSDETDVAQSMANAVKDDLDAYVCDTNLALPIIASYVPLHTLVAGVGDTIDVPLQYVDLWREQVLEPQRENCIKEAIPIVGCLNDGVTLNVRQQYEENPYPRWRHPDVETSSVPFRMFLKNQFPSLNDRDLPDAREMRIFIAGCGTGSHPIHTASRFRNASVVAMDLSLASLGHAVRKTEEMGVTNIQYVQGDLLQCSELNERFDLIESIGVLHHLESPQAGLAKLVEVLKPGGFMRLAFYSRAARSYIRDGQAFVKKNGYGVDIGGIRQCRADLVACQGKETAAEIVKDFDFYSASGCRDLIMHVQEHQYDLSELRDMTENCGLRLLGFANMPRWVRQAYLRKFPQDSEMADWDQVASFESENPDAFSGMYGFWLQKSSV